MELGLEDARCTSQLAIDVLFQLAFHGRIGAREENCRRNLGSACPALHGDLRKRLDRLVRILLFVSGWHDDQIRLRNREGCQSRRRSFEVDKHKARAAPDRCDLVLYRALAFARDNLDP